MTLDKTIVESLLTVTGESTRDRYDRVSEEYGEFVQAYSKWQRKKGCEFDIIQEAIDLMNAVYAYLKSQGVSDEYIESYSEEKFQRAIDRCMDHGEL